MTHITFGTIIEWYLDFLGSRPSARRYGKIYEKQFAGGELAGRAAHLVTTYDILLYKQQHEHAPAQCRKGLQMITQAYNWASQTIDRESKTPLYMGPNPEDGSLCHSFLVAGYKIYDRYAMETGFRDQRISPGVFTIINPEVPNTHPDFVTHFWDMATGIFFLKALRRRYK